MRYEDIDISSSEQGKYNQVNTGGGHSGLWTRVYYNDDGSINEKETYNSNYLRKLEESRSPKEEPKPREQPRTKRSDDDEETSSEDSGQTWFEKLFIKILLFPFKLLWGIVKVIWWILKKVLKIVLTCLLLGWLADAMGLGSDDN